MTPAARLASGAGGIIGGQSSMAVWSGAIVHFHQQKSSTSKNVSDESMNQPRGLGPAARLASGAEGCGASEARWRFGAERQKKRPTK